MFFNASTSHNTSCSLRLAGLWSKSLGSKKCQSSLRWLQRLPPQRQLKNTASWDLLSFACAFRVTQQPPYTETRRHVRVCKSQILFLQHSTRSRYSVYYSEFLICVLHHALALTLITPLPRRCLAPLPAIADRSKVSKSSNLQTKANQLAGKVQQLWSKFHSVASDGFIILISHSFSSTSHQIARALKGWQSLDSCLRWGWRLLDFWGQELKEKAGRPGRKLTWHEHPIGWLTSRMPNAILVELLL